MTNEIRRDAGSTWVVWRNPCVGDRHLDARDVTGVDLPQMDYATVCGATAVVLLVTDARNSAGAIATAEMLDRAGLLIGETERGLAEEHFCE